MKQKIVSLALVFALCVAMAVPAFALESSITPQEAADYLYQLGLFKGAGTGQDGKPIYDLEKTATRGEGITMFVRLLGKEAEVTANTYTTPFTDVPTWAKGYVGYAYTNGLTKGTSATTFSTLNLISSYEFLTLCLRALGYQEGTEFTYKDPITLATSLGIVTQDEWTDNSKTFTRGDMVVISYHVLNANMADGGKLDIGEANSRWKDKDESGLVGDVVEVDAGSKDNLLPDGLGGYALPLENLSDGTIITRDDLVYTAGATTNQNLSNLINVLTEINPNITWTGKAISYLGNNLAYVTASNGTWNIRISSWDNGKDSRNMFLTSLAYFGNKSMASAVYSMMDEHYTKRTDTSTPIPAEIANKYGLSIVSESITSDIVAIRITNGPSSWTVYYSVGTTISMKDVLVKIDLQ